jgi:hypothetical protein
MSIPGLFSFACKRFFENSFEKVLRNQIFRYLCKTKAKKMTNKIQIEKINYFGEDVTKSNDWNAKVLYRVNGKLQHAMIFVDFWTKDFFINSKIQAKECKVAAGLLIALRNMKSEYFKI